MKWKPSTRLTALIALILVVSGISSGIALRSTYRMQALMRDMRQDNLTSVRAAHELEKALLEQRGLTSSYVLGGGNRAYLAQLRQVETRWVKGLAEAERNSHSPAEHLLVQEVGRVYAKYHASRDHAIAAFDAGRLAEAARLIVDLVAPLSQLTFDNCEHLVAMNEAHVDADMRQGAATLGTATLGVVLSLLFTLIAGVALLALLIVGTFRPLRRLAEDARTFGAVPAGVEAAHADELNAVGFYLRSLMSELSETRSRLEKSKDSWELSGKLVNLGKLAACVAHEIRHPLTSLKLGLYSLRSGIEGQPKLERVCDLLESELRRLDRMVQNVLEFSRPPDVRLETLDAHVVMDDTLELFAQRFRTGGVKLERTNGCGPMMVRVDADQLKQVYLDLLVNAVEAMPDGGMISIHESLEPDASGHPVATVSIADSGPGVPDSVRARMFEPFVTTKREGTGLGLTIAASIVARLGGRLELQPSSGAGAEFVVRIPTMAGVLR